MDADLKSIAAARRAAETAFEAYRAFLGTDPAQVDAIVDAMARAIEPEAERLGQLAVEETGYGNVPDKRVKNLFNALSVADYLRDVTTLGMLWRDDATKIAAFGEPMGVVAALVPVTNPTSTIIFKVLSAVKAGNAIVCAPHPRGVSCGIETVRIMARVAEQMGAPKGLIQCLDAVTIQGTAELMRHRRTSVVMATGGPAMVKAAYSSGKPTLAVGAGNVPCYVHKSKARDLAEVAEMIVTSKSFDYGTACVSEQAVVADPEIARDLRHELKLKGAYFCTPAEADRLAGVIFKGAQAMDPERVGQSPQALADAAGFSIPPRTRCLVSEETEVGWQRPLSAEKLNPVLAFYEAKSTDHGIELAQSIAKFEGWGHSSVIHSDDADVVARFATVPTGRVLVNTPGIMGGMGYSTDLEPSFMLGTGTWSGSITSDNVTALHLINIKRVAYESRPWRDIYEEYGA
ncbi:aldehyde dehydrogenase family protein [Falsiruegeria mediterranea]|jgi:acetaldehyde dehydrogenase (acetylating)|uniref:Aldehyde-alcohol dehydrogenase n=1 Tax=Falsiruegeria mediterranea M17 TaxID=1200281 RepID=A0A2R8CET5_9RHOB|nr:aldehyde dehydrogenase family protein [Falsiruegeria mediterranea]SPJ30927.1 Aldehyde-alcohol dehydrogenase [Falsiruegeria mediterranea M17]